MVQFLQTKSMKIFFSMLHSLESDANAPEVQNALMLVIDFPDKTKKKKTRKSFAC